MSTNVNEVWKLVERQDEAVSIERGRIGELERVLETIQGLAYEGMDDVHAHYHWLEQIARVAKEGGGE